MIVCLWDIAYLSGMCTMWIIQDDSKGKLFVCGNEQIYNAIGGCNPNHRL